MYLGLLRNIALVFTSFLLLGSAYAEPQQCQSCHQEQVADWQASHHFRAMNPATAEFVLGAFDGQRIAFEKQMLTLSKEGDDFVLHREYPNGSKESEKVHYTFGYQPLQQYLVADERGGYQFIPLAWDSRTKEEGGQRWFILHPQQRSTDEFHHTQMGQNWNHMCADCHSTDFKKQFSSQSNRFASSYAAINIDCAACHGDSQQHLQWAEGDKNIEHKGFSKDISTQIALFSRGADGSLLPQGEVKQTEQIAQCATCHARRSQLADREPHAELLDTFKPALLTPQLYHVDGQILDEDYVWGSFLQSKMYAAGVTCSNCHNPHSGKLKLDGNQTCTQCHDSSQYQSTEHHGHTLGSTGSQCVDCHMPSTTYMQVDPRRDHSLRVPRPDLSIQTQAPNACNGCHQDKTPQWAVNAIKTWHPDSNYLGKSHFSQAFYAADQGLPTASQLLTRIAQSSEYTDIIRASALARMARYPDKNTLVAISRAVRDEEPLKRLGAIEAARGFPLPQRYTLLQPLLADPRLAIRTGAARALAAMLVVPFPNNLQDAPRAELAKALEEYRQTERYNSERASSHTNLGNLALELEQIKVAHQHYEQAIAVEPIYIPAYVNLADLYRRQGDEGKVRAVLTQALQQDADNAAVHYALAMSWVREKNRTKAKEHLALAAQYGSVNHIYTYGLLLNEMGETQGALTQLARAFALDSNNADLCYTLVQIHINEQNYRQALRYATRLQELVPRDPQIAALVEKLTLMQSVTP
ncbi:tetratricopeptide repeat protein [Pseudoalteromonas sp. T1lg76]|uniref:tetratricopeptide repeat protein n=1 Tax=Pseudoalteromonas sp. T1lg76 TaxID=2077103 RepID=UPI000CF603E5|nr:tetratricopeptide repeat protein [Pseudoalteromonas sp. T1lg76]